MLKKPPERRFFYFKAIILLTYSALYNKICFLKYV